MPTTYNGIGTWYYGKKNSQDRVGICRACGAQGRLESYDTRLWFVLLMIPVIPLKRKRILDKCSNCRRHFAADLDKWEMSKQLEVTGAAEKYRNDPSPEAAAELHAHLLMYGMVDEAANLRSDVLQIYPDDVVLQQSIAEQLDATGHFQEATPLYEAAHTLRPEIPEIRVALARRRMASGELDQARELLKFLEEPGSGQVYSLKPLEILAQAYQAKGRHEEVVELCKHILQELPEAGKIHAFRAFIAKSEKKLASSSESILAEQSRGWLSAFDVRNPQFSSGERFLAYAALVLMLIGAGMAGVNEYKRWHRTVHVLNPFQRPISVAVDDNPAAEIWRHGTIELPEGSHTVRFTGVVEDQFELNMKTGYFERWTRDPVWVINPCGATAFVHSTLYYARNPVPPTSQIFMGERSYFFNHIDYAFTPPPEQIQVSNSNTAVTRSQLVWESVPAIAYARYALTDLEPAKAMDVIEAHLTATPDDTDLHLAYHTAALSNDLIGRAISFLGAGLWNEPLSLDWHLRYQELIDQETTLALIAEYDKRLTGEPRNALLLYLRGSCSDDEDSLEYFAKACDADPNLAWPWLALAFQSATRGDWKASLLPIQKAFQLRPDDSSVQKLWHMALLANGNYEQLEDRYRQQLLNPISAAIGDALVYLVDVYAVQNKSQDAWRAFAQWKNMAPGMVDPGYVHEVEMCLAYMVGDGERIANPESAPSGPSASQFRFQWLLSCGQIDEALGPELEPLLENPFNSLALSVALDLAGRKEEASQWLATSCSRLATASVRMRELVEMLQSEEPPTSEQLDSLELDSEWKSLGAAALAVRFPNENAHIVRMARLHNVSRCTPHRLVKNVIDTFEKAETSR